MAFIRTLDHVGITVADLDRAIEFFVDLGRVVDGRTSLEGAFLDDVVGLPGARTEIVRLTTPGGGAGVELARFHAPEAVVGSPDAPANELGLRSIAFQVDDLRGAVARVAASGYGLVGAIGEYEGAWAMASVRGPEGIVVSLAERLTG